MLKAEGHTFVSYSRKDVGFVLRLQAAFKAAGRVAWVDLNDIPPASVYRKEIEDAIIHATAVVFVLSPDSAASAACQVELQWAEKHGKRLIPLRYRDVSPEAVPEVVERLNWISFSSDDDFPESFRALLETIDTDREWVAQHTRLETRASEWQRAQGDPSLLLMGSDLRRAEEWLARSYSQTPPHTEWQAAFIAASRRAATRRQRRLLAGVTIALAVAVVFGALALYGGIRSARLGRQALSRQLAAQSSVALDEELDLALLLAVEACRAARSVEATGSLLAALQREPHLVAFLHGHTQSVDALAFSSDGALLASAGADSAVIVWNVPELSIARQYVQAHRGPVLCVAFSPDNASVASGGEDGATRIWGMQHPDQPPIALPEDLYPVTAVCYTNDGRLLASATSAGVLSLWDIGGGHISGVGQTDDGDALECLQFTPDDQRLITGSSGGVISVWDVVSCRPLCSTRDGHDGAIMALACDERGARVVTGAEDRTIQAWELDALTPMGAPWGDHGARFAALAISRDGTRLASTGSEAALTRWDAASHSPIWTSQYGAAREYASLALHPSQDLIATGTRGGDVLLWSGDPSLPLCRTVAPLSAWVGATALADNGSLQALVTGDTVVVIRSLADPSSAPRSVSGRAPVSAAALLPERRMAATGEEDGVIRLWELGSGRLIGEYPLEPPDRLQTIRFDPQGRFLAAEGRGEFVYLVRIDEPPGRSAPLVGCIEEATTLAFSSDGALLVAGDRRGQLIVWDVGNPQPFCPPLAEHRSAIADLAFSSGGDRLASVDVSGEVLIWDARAWRSVRRRVLAREAGLVTAVAFSRDDAMIAAGGWDGSIRLWNAADLSALGNPLQGHHGPIAELGFASSGTMLVSVGNDGETLLWDLDVRNLTACARRIANRDLTRSEWSRYLGGTPWRARSVE